MKLPKKLKSLATLAKSAKEASRIPNLDKLHVQEREDGYKIQVGDGYVFAIAQTATESRIISEMLVDAKEFEQEVKGGPVELGMLPNSGEDPGKFPKLESCIPKGVYESVLLDPELILRGVKVISDILKSKPKTVELRYFGKEKPIGLHAKSDDGISVRVYILEQRKGN